MEAGPSSEGAGSRPGRRALGRLARSGVAHAVARAGFVTKAFLYANIGVFALRHAWGGRGPLLDVKGALTRLSRSSFGPPLSGVVGVGLACLGAGFVIEALLGRPGARGAWAAVTRLGQAVGGIAYVGLGLAGVRILLGLNAGPSGDALARQGVAEALGVPGGPAMAVVAGALGIGIGIRQAVQGISRSFLGSLDLRQASGAIRRLVVLLGTAGFTAQGGLFGAAGGLILRAAWRHDPGEAGGTRGVLKLLVHEPDGYVLLAVVAIGLVAYAGYAIAEASARRFPAG